MKKVFKYYHGTDGLIRNEDDQKDGSYSSPNPKVDLTYSVDVFHPDIIKGGDEVIIDNLYKMQIHNLPQPPWLLSVQ